MSKPPTKEVALDLITKAGRQEQNVKLKLRQLVAQARELGVSWEEIGEALGVTKQGAHQRFGNGTVPKSKAIEKWAKATGRTIVGEG